MNDREFTTPNAPERVTRREFSRTVASLGAAAALAPLAGGLEACASLPTAASIERRKAPPAPVRPELAGADFATWHAIAERARLAPTPHNTQPFRIRPVDARTAEIVALGERFLPEEDHGNRYVASAFGILCATIELAARSVGASVTTTPTAQVNVAELHRASAPTVLGVATIVGETAPASDGALLEIRRTSRIPYQDRLVDPAIWTELQAATSAHGHRLLEYNDPKLVAATLRLNVDAIIDNLALTRERKEIQHWYRTGPTPQFGDGLWQVPLNQGAFEIRTAFGSPFLYRLPIIRPIARHDYLKTQLGTRHIVLLCGAFSSWPELVGAGRALFDMWVGMARHGVYIQPMGSMLTNSRYAARIAERFEVTDCWLVMRAGFSDVPPRAPRLESILI